jgi:hypothetical protein
VVAGAFVLAMAALASISEGDLWGELMGLDFAALLTCPVCHGELRRAVCEAEVVHYRCPDCDGDRHRSVLVELREWLQEVAGIHGEGETS